MRGGGGGWRFGGGLTELALHFFVTSGGFEHYFVQGDALAAESGVVSVEAAFSGHLRLAFGTGR